MILELSELLSRSVERTLEDRIAISFSGGLDSTVIAAIARRHAEVDLFTAGVSGSEDLEYAERAARELGLPLHKIVIDEGRALSAYDRVHSILPMDFLKLEILIPVYHVAEAASKSGHQAILFGSAAEELFVGYERYYQYRDEGKDVDSILREEFRTLPQRDLAWVKKVCREFGVEARFPLYNRDLAERMFAVPIEERMDDRELKKGMLREAGKVLGAPSEVLKRRKRAMQYGSGIHKLLLKNSDAINKNYPAS